MHQAVLIRIIAIGFLIGIALADGFSLRVPFAVLVISCFLLPFAMAFRRSHTAAGVTLALATALVIGIGWQAARAEVPLVSPLTETRFRGTVLERTTYGKRDLVTLHLSDPGALAGRTIVFFVSSDAGFSFEESVTVNCDPYAQSEAVQSTGVVGGIPLFHCLKPSIIAREPGRGVRAYLFSVRTSVSRLYHRFLPEPEAAFIAAMVLNERSALPAPVRTDFSRSGLIHIISISGLHMALVIGVLEALLAGFGIARGFRLGIIAIFIAVYLLLLGFPAPAVRSACMSLLFFSARYAGRPYDGIHVLVLTAVLMVAGTPSILLRDVSFQFSCMALLGMATTMDLWREALRFLPDMRGIRESVVTTLAAQVFTWPLGLYYFHSFSLVAPAANAIAIPAVAPVLILAFLLPVAHIVLFSGFVAAPLYLGVHYLILAARAGSRLPFAALQLGSFPFWALCAGYFCIAWSVYLLRRILVSGAPLRYTGGRR